MGEDDFKLFVFYCWQLKITTLYQLQQIKQQYNVKSNNDLLDLLCKLYNSDYYKITDAYYTKLFNDRQKQLI